MQGAEPFNVLHSSSIKHYYDVWHLAKGIYHPLIHA